jgi:hypothetical protein
LQKKPMVATLIKIENNTIIYVVCPAHIVTGGVEAVHQLVDKLRKFGHDARIVTTPEVENPTLIQYRNYDVRFARTIVDNRANLLITTEVNPQVLAHYRFIQKAIWGLSVDNHQNLLVPFDFTDQRNSSVVHLAQSAYAIQFLRAKGVGSICRLTDYLHADYFRVKSRAKNNLVLYTPFKGGEAYVERLRQADSSLTWFPLKGMIRKMHAQMLRKGKVYVDFGSHPGMDRQPREAVVNGCCVLVGLRGSACFNEDLPIPSHYKFDLESFDVEDILGTIKSCLVSYEENYREFVDYARLVRSEERLFEQEVVDFAGSFPSRSRARWLVIIANIISFVKENSAFIAMRGLANELVPLWLVTPLNRQWRQAKESHK